MKKAAIFAIMAVIGSAISASAQYTSAANWTWSTTPQTVAAGGSFNMNLQLQITNATTIPDFEGSDLIVEAVNPQSSNINNDFAITNVTPSISGYIQTGFPSFPDNINTTNSDHSGFIQNKIDSGVVGPPDQPASNYASHTTFETLAFSIAPGTPAGTYTFSSTGVYTSSTSGFQSGRFSDIADNAGTVFPMAPASFVITVGSPIPPNIWTGGSTGTSNWTDSSNWSQGHAPANGDNLSFGANSRTTNSDDISSLNVTNLTFSPAAPAFSIHIESERTLIISGAGVINNSGSTQTLINDGGSVSSANGGKTEFLNSSTAGNATINNNVGSGGTGPTDTGGLGGSTEFHDNSTAGNATINNNGSTPSDFNGGFTHFFDNSNAGSATINNNGSTTNPIFPAGGGETDFHDNSTADSATINNNGGAIGGASGGKTQFLDTSTAGNATINNSGGTGSTGNGGLPGITEFHNSSMAVTATINNNGGANSGATGGVTGFFDTSTAGSAVITNNAGTVSNAGGGETVFHDTSTAGSATMIANGGIGGGGSIIFLNDSNGGTSQVEVFGNGNLDISKHDSTGVTVGSIEGDGNVFLGANTLTVGSNNASTTFSGVIQDGSNGSGGSLTKIGTGALTLSGANTYTGPTTVDAGRFVVNGSIAGPVTVNSGTFGGSGTTGSITVNSGGSLSPGDSPGILHIMGNLSLTAGSNYLVDLNGPTVGTQYDQADVTGMVSLGNANLLLNLGFQPVAGTIFTIINDELTNPITGLFDGLQEGAMFSTDGEDFMISYRGGDGNDVVLTAEATPTPSPSPTPSGGVPDSGETFMLLGISTVALIGLKKIAALRA